MDSIITFQDVQDEYFKSFAKKAADLINQTDKNERDSNELVVTMEKQIVLDTLAQVVIFEFGNKRNFETYPFFVPNSQTTINLDSILNDFDNTANSH